MSARAIPTLPPWLTLGNTVVTPAQMEELNTYMQFFSSPPMFKMHQTAGQSLANGAFGQITMDTPDYDTESGRGSSTPWSYTVPAGQGGRWGLALNAAWVGNATGLRGGLIYQNGSVVTGGLWSCQAGPSGTVTCVGGYIEIVCSGGDALAAYGYQSSGGSLSTSVATGFNSFFCGRMVSLANP